MTGSTTETGRASAEQGGVYAYDVIVVGGGPVGLAAAWLLGRQGIRTVLVEKRQTTTQLPKGQYVHASSAELYRQWGVIDDVRAGGWPFARHNGQGLYSSLSSGPIAESLLWAGDEESYQSWYREFTPEHSQFVPASIYEAALRTATEQWLDVELAFGAEVIDIAQSPGRVRVVAKNVSDGSERILEARYLIAADGANSFIRRELDFTEDTGPDFGQQVVTEFHGPLERYVGAHPYFQYWVLNPEASGWFGSRHPQTGEWRFNFTNPDGQTVTPDIIKSRIRTAIGDPDFPIDIVTIGQFRYTTALARTWRKDNVFLAGDSAHRFAPWGGFGANLGLQEINNLAWKLALVLQGHARDGLLDTYEGERRPKAAATLKVATYNTFNTQGMLAAGLALERLPDGGLSEEARVFLAQTLPLGRPAGFAHVGHQFGAIYKSPAIVADGTTPPLSTVGVYNESASPGARAPHLWLTAPSGETVSVQDLYRGRFILLVAGDDRSWRTAAEAAAELVDAHVIGDSGYAPQSDRWARLYGLEPGGAVLIRPDGFVGARFVKRPDAPVSVLANALSAILAQNDAIAASDQKGGLAA